jgi:hypothetical protein
MLRIFSIIVLMILSLIAAGYHVDGGKHPCLTIGAVMKVGGDCN